jgi:hypothetical protein
MDNKVKLKCIGALNPEKYSGLNFPSQDIGKTFLGTIYKCSCSECYFDIGHTYLHPLHADKCHKCGNKLPVNIKFYNKSQFQDLNSDFELFYDSF